MSDVLLAVRWDDPDAVALREARRREIAEAYLREGSEPAGSEATGADVTAFLVAYDDGGPVGCGCLRIIGEGVDEIKRRYVVPARRGSRVSPAIFKALEDCAVAHHLRVLRLETGDLLVAAQRFYERRADQTATSGSSDWSMGKCMSKSRVAKTLKVVRVIAYVRVSKEREEMISPELQEDAIRAACARKAGYTLLRVISDLDKSGRNFAREGVREAIREVQEGRADVVMVWRFSRFGRNSLDYRVNMALVETAGGQLEAALEEVDARTSTGRLMRGLLIEFAEYESERTSEGWKEAHASRLGKGLPTSGRFKFGYDYHRCDHGCPGACRTAYRPDPVTGPVLASLYRRYLEGVSFPVLRDWCKETGQPRERGGVWMTSSITDLLDSGFGAGLIHAGTWMHNGARMPEVWMPGAHEPVIEVHEWEAYRERRLARRHVPSSHKAPVYPLTGLVFCGQCGGAMFAASSKRGKGYLYRCNTAQNTGECPGVWLTRSRVEGAVLDALDPYAQRQEDAARRALRAPRARAPVPASVSPAERARADEREAAAALERLVRAVAAGTLSDGEAAAEARRLRAVRDEAARVLASLAVRRKEAAPAVRVRAQREQWGVLPAPARRVIVAELFERVVVHADKSVEVVPRFGRGDGS